MPEPKKFRLTKILLSEISLVDMPAEPNSQVHVFKRGQAANQEADVDELEKIKKELTDATAQITTLTAAVTKANSERDQAIADKAASDAKVTALAKAATGPQETPEEVLLKSMSPEVATQFIALQKANAASQKALADIAEKDEIRKHVGIAKADYGHLPIKPDDFGPILKRASGVMTPEDFGELTRILKAADVFAVEATTIKGFGRDLPPSSAEQEIHKRAVEISREEKISVAKAEVLAMQRDPALYAKYQAERQDQPVN